VDSIHTQNFVASLLLLLTSLHRFLPHTPPNAIPSMALYTLLLFRHYTRLSCIILVAPFGGTTISNRAASLQNKKNVLNFQQETFESSESREAVLDCSAIRGTHCKYY
jgi:hypothetical protein